MPRRPQRDYSYLSDRPLSVILVSAIANPVYTVDGVMGDLRVNQFLLRYYEGQDRLALSELVPRYNALRESWGKPVTWSEQFTGDYVGTRVGCGVRLGLLVDAPGEDGEPGWRMPDRELHFEEYKGGCRRIRGLPSEEQGRMNRKLAARAALRSTLDWKHAKKIAPAVRSALTSITDADPDALIPQQWGHFTGDLAAEWPLVREAQGLLAEIHYRWTRDRQAEWLHLLRCHVSTVRFDAQRRGAQAQRDLAEDAPAFADL